METVEGLQMSGDPISTIMNLDRATETSMLAYKWEVIGLEDGLDRIVAVLCVMALIQLCRMFVDSIK